MAEKKFITHINLNRQQLLNAALQNLAVFPSTADLNGVPFPVGYVFYHTGQSTAYAWTADPEVGSPGQEGWLDLGQVYTHPSFPSGAFPATPQTGAWVPSKIIVSNGHITDVIWRQLTPADIGASTAVHTHAFNQITGLPSNTILGNNTGSTGTAQALTVNDVLTMLGIAYGTLAQLNAGTDTSQRTWSAKDLSDWLQGKLGTYLTVVNLAIGTRTGTTLPITNSAGTGVTLPVATTTLAGLMSAADKLKLDGIQDGANNYVHPTQNPGVHPFATEITSGVTVLSQLVVNNEGHTVAIKGRNLTAADLAAVMINDSINNGTNQTWSSSKIYQELQNAINQAQTGALQYKGEYNPVTNTPQITNASLGVKTGWTYVVSTTGTFLGEQVEAGDMIIAKTDDPLTDPTKWQLVNKNIPAIVSATTTIQGIVRLATSADLAANDNTTAVTPALLNAALSSTVGGYHTLLGNGSSTTFAITHNLNTTHVIVQVFEVATGDEIEVQIRRTSDTVVTLLMNIPPDNNAYEVEIKK